MARTQGFLDHRLVSDVTRDFLPEGIKGHHTEVNIAPGAHCNGTCVLLFVTDDKDVRQLLYRMLSDFTRYFLIAQVISHSKIKIPQLFSHVILIFFCSVPWLSHNLN